MSFYLGETTFVQYKKPPPSDLLFYLASDIEI